MYERHLRGKLPISFRVRVHFMTVKIGSKDRYDCRKTGFYSRELRGNFSSVTYTWFTPLWTFWAIFPCEVSWDAGMIFGDWLRFWGWRKLEGHFSAFGKWMMTLRKILHHHYLWGFSHDGRRFHQFLKATYIAWRGQGWEEGTQSWLCFFVGLTHVWFVLHHACCMQAAPVIGVPLLCTNAYRIPKCYWWWAEMKNETFQIRARVVLCSSWTNSSKNRLLLFQVPYYLYEYDDYSLLRAARHATIYPIISLPLFQISKVILHANWAYVCDSTH